MGAGMNSRENKPTVFLATMVVAVSLVMVLGSLAYAMAHGRQSPLEHIPILGTLFEQIRELTGTVFGALAVLIALPAAYSLFKRFRKQGQRP